MHDRDRPPFLRLAEWWTATSSGILVGRTDPTEVAALERRYGGTIPAGFRNYLLCTCPQNDPSWDNELTNWWPIARIKNIPEEYNQFSDCAAIRDRAESFLFFADYSIWCWAWAICCDESEHRGKVAVIGGKDRFVAPTFDHFVQSYIADPAGVAVCPT